MNATRYDHDSIPAVAELERRLVAAIAAQQTAGSDAGASASAPLPHPVDAGGAACAIGERVGATREVRRLSRKVRRPGRRARRFGIGAGIAAAALAVGAMLLPAQFTAPAEAQMHATEHGDLVVLEFSVLNGSTDLVNSELRALGFEFGVQFVPASPSLLGEFVGATFASGIDDPDAAADAITVDYVAGERPGDDVATLRFDRSGSLPEVIHVGRRTAPDEDYAVVAPATAAGEALACLDLWVPRQDAVRLMDAHGLGYSFRGEGGHVVNVLPQNADTMIVFLRDAPLTATERAELHDYAYAGCD